MTEPERDATLIYRTRLPVRIWHWINAVTILVMVMSGMAIFNAHPRLYWGKFGANPDHAWLEISNHGTVGFVNVTGIEFVTTGWLGYAGNVDLAFPLSVTLPHQYDLALSRGWHFAGAWVLALGWLIFAGYSIFSRHLQNDLLPKSEELKPRALWADIKAHARLHLPRGEAARRYNPLQKIAYVVILGLVLPTLILTGLTMSPAMDAAWPWLLTLFGGRQSARSLHFLAALAIVTFVVVHLMMVVLAGPINELRSMITGWYRLPQERDQ